MLGIFNGSQDLLRLLLSAALVSSLFGPVFHNSPICSEGWVLASFLCECHPETGDVQELREIVYIIFRRLLWRELVLLGPSRDACLEGAFDCITRNVICTGVSSGLEQGGGIVQSLRRQALEFESIHPRHQDIATCQIGDQRRPACNAGAINEIHLYQAGYDSPIYRHGSRLSPGDFASLNWPTSLL